MAKKPYVNDSRNERTGHEQGGSVGKQGGHGTGKVKCSADGGSSKSPDFKPASEVIGAPIAGELDVPGTGLMKGSNAVGYEGPKKGNPGKPMGGAGGIRKSKDAQDAGH
jgi:hypothetical protein